MMNEVDMHYMERALLLAARGRGRTSPNPMVGAVVVKDGQVIGEGYHPRAGDPHAEVFALDAAGVEAAGADLYVTLEPCCHHGRTPPCTRKIISSGVRRVVVATLDPNPLVAGRGIAELQAVGTDVVVGVKEAEACQLNEAFMTYMKNGRPFVIAKWAMTLDGKIACATNDSRWVSGELSRQWVHKVRDEVDGIMVGVGTVLADNPQLTTRLADRGVEGKDPVRIILDTHLRTPPDARLLTAASSAPTWIVCGDGANAKASPLKSISNVEIVSLPTRQGFVDLRALLKLLAERSIVSVLLEGGATLNYTAFSEQVVDKLYCFIAPKIVGGALAPSPVGGVGMTKMSLAWPVDVHKTARVGEDILIEGYPIYKEDSPCSQV